MLKLTRARFEEMIDNILQGTIEPSKRAMRDASVAQNDIKKVVLVGGSTHIPKVVRLVRDLFGREPSRSVC
jgi:molecular chaperone DnaK